MSPTRIDCGPRMSDAVVAGGFVWLAGQIPEATVGQSVAAQTQEALGFVDEFLARAGTDKTRLVTATVWLTDIARFAEMNAVWDAWIAPGCAPARAAVQSKLASPGVDVEIMVVAAL